MRQANSPKLVYGVLLSGAHVVSYVEKSKHPLKIADLILIINFVRSSASLSHAHSVHFTPICLPNFNAAGFLQAYIGMLAPDVCLILICTENDPRYFHILAGGKETVQQQMDESGVLTRIVEATAALPQQVASLEVPGLLHFIYLHQSGSQHFSSGFHKDWDNPTSRSRLWRRYQQLHCRFRDSSRKLVCEINRHECMVALSGSGFELYAAFKPLVTATAASNGCDAIVRWVKRQESSLFVPSPPTWPS